MIFINSLARAKIKFKVEVFLYRSLILFLYSFKIRFNQIIWDLFGRTIRRRVITPLWKRFLITLKSSKRGYPDYLPNILNEAIEEFIEGKYFSSVITSSTAVEWILISELKRENKNHLGWGLGRRIKMAESILPVYELLDKNEEDYFTCIFVKRRNAIAHGNIHEIPIRIGRFEKLLEIPVYSRSPKVDADDAYDQLTKALRFLIKWRIKANIGKSVPNFL